MYDCPIIIECFADDNCQVDLRFTYHYVISSKTFKPKLVSTKITTNNNNHNLYDLVNALDSNLINEKLDESKTLVLTRVKEIQENENE